MSKMTAERRMAPQLKRTFLIVLPITLGGILLDQLTKVLAILHLKDQGPVVCIPGILQLHYAENTGAAFSMLNGQRYFFIGLTVLVLAIVTWILWKGLLKNAFGYCALALCLSGTIGNFIDRLIRGYVVDLFEPTFISFAIFNVADICLTIGAILLAVYLLFFHEDRPEKKTAEQPSSDL